MQLESKEASGAYRGLHDYTAYLVPYIRRIDGRGIGINILE
jgi:hypothetical protein